MGIGMQQDMGRAPMVSAIYSSWNWSFPDPLRAKLDEKAGLSLLISLHEFRLRLQNVKERIRLKGTNCYIKLWQTEDVCLCICGRERGKEVLTIPGMVQENEDFLTCHSHRKQWCTYRKGLGRSKILSETMEQVSFPFLAGMVRANDSPSSGPIRVSKFSLPQ